MDAERPKLPDAAAVQLFETGYSQRLATRFEADSGI